MGESVKNTTASDFGSEMWDMGEAISTEKDGNEFERGYVPDLAAFRPAEMTNRNGYEKPSKESRGRTERKLATLAKILTRRDRPADTPHSFEEIQVDIEDWIESQNINKTTHSVENLASEPEGANAQVLEFNSQTRANRDRDLAAVEAAPTTNVLLPEPDEVSIDASSTEDQVNRDTDPVSTSFSSLNTPSLDENRTTITEPNSTIAEAQSSIGAFQEANNKFPNDEEKYRVDVEFWAKEYNDTERQFASYQQVQPFRQSSGRQAPPSIAFRKTLRQYEEDQAYNWHRLASATNQAQTAGFLSNKYAVASTQRLGSVEPDQTIEATTGIFYHERAFELQKAIRAGDSATSAAEFELVNHTLTKVSEYLLISSDSESKRRDLDYYRVQRQSAHNNMITHLNNLNALAERYGTERFTLRDFITDDFNYSQRLDRGGHLNHRAEYDRETVLAYFQTAFSQDFAKMQRELS